MRMPILECTQVILHVYMLCLFSAFHGRSLACAHAHNIPVWQGFSQEFRPLACHHLMSWRLRRALELRNG